MYIAKRVSRYLCYFLRDEPLGHESKRPGQIKMFTSQKSKELWANCLFIPSSYVSYSETTSTPIFYNTLVLSKFLHPSIMSRLQALKFLLYQHWGNLPLFEPVLSDVGVFHLYPQSVTIKWQASDSNSVMTNYKVRVFNHCTMFLLAD